MSGLGWFLAVVGIVLAFVGFMQRRKLKKIAEVPFRRPSEIASMGPGAADAKGRVSSEGTVTIQQPLVAPMSGQPCLAYEVKIERKWEKNESDGKGEVSTRTGTDTTYSHYEGGTFQLRDESGAVTVDASKRPDVTLEQSHSHTERMGIIVPSALAFGQMQFQVPLLPKDSRTTAFVGTEKILKPAGALYALGQLDVGTSNGPTITTPKGLLTGQLLLSTKGRGHLVATTERNVKLAFGLAIGFFVIGTPMGIFGDHGSSASASTAPSSPMTSQPGGPTAMTGATGTPVPGAALAIGQTVQGILTVASPTPVGSAGPANDYPLPLVAGHAITIFTIGGVRTDANAVAGHLDVLTMLLCNGAEVARDDDGAGDLNSRIAYTPTTTGVCTVRVTGFAGQHGAYSVHVLDGNVAELGSAPTGGTQGAGAAAAVGGPTYRSCVRNRGAACSWEPILGSTDEESLRQYCQIAPGRFGGNTPCPTAHLTGHCDLGHAQNDPPSRWFYYSGHGRIDPSSDCASRGGTYVPGA